MAGHSKWANIKHRKGRQDEKRGVLFSKLARAITVAAKQGLPDPDANAALAQAIQAAKDQSMPKDNIERALQKAIGGADGDNYESVMYEGYGPNGVAVIVEALTDNRNRTASEVRYAFSRHNGNLGTTGCVAYLFSRVGRIEMAEGANEEDVMLAALDAGAEDVEGDDGFVTVQAEPASMMDVRRALEAAGLEVATSEVVLHPSTTVELDESNARQALNLVDALEELDDVQRVSANFDISDQVLEAVAGD